MKESAVNRRHLGLIWTAVAALTFTAPAEAQDCGLYEYRAVVTKVYDGDTITADVDLGFNTWRHDESLRLVGIDAPEMRGNERPQAPAPAMHCASGSSAKRSGYAPSGMRRGSMAAIWPRSF